MASTRAMRPAHLALEEVEGDDGRDGDHQADGGRHQRLGDAGHDRRARRRPGCATRSANALMMPSTVPNRPMKGALLPSVPSTPRLRSSSSAQRATWRWPSPRTTASRPRSNCSRPDGGHPRPPARAGRASAWRAPATSPLAQQRAAARAPAPRGPPPAAQGDAALDHDRDRQHRQPDEQPQHPLGAEQGEAKESFGQAHSSGGRRKATEAAER